jgi:hypothetical protein
MLMSFALAGGELKNPAAQIGSPSTVEFHVNNCEVAYYAALEGDDDTTNKLFLTCYTISLNMTAPSFLYGAKVEYLQVPPRRKPSCVSFCHG